MAKLNSSHIELSDKEYRAARDWYKSQVKWHSMRNGEWHKSQVRYYKNQLFRISTFSRIVEETIKRNCPVLIKHIYSTNSLLIAISGKLKKE